MPADPGAIRALAHRLRTQADDVRREADRLVALLDSTPWHGRTAEAARARGRERAGVLRGTAALHDTAATALDRHAHEVERRRELIAHVERVVAGLVEEAVQTAADGGARVRELVVPPPGAREWLDVDVRSVAAVLEREAV